MRTEISPGFSEAAWSAIPISSALHSTRWLRAMASRLPGAPYTFTHQSGLALFGVVVADPHAYEAYNPYAVLWRDPPVFDVADEAARRDRLARLDGTPDRLLPALALVAPGYDGDPAGPAAGDPALLTECLRDVVEWAREHGLAGVYPLYTRSPAVTGAVAALGGASFPLTSRWVLPVWWDDWESYLHGLAPKRRRKIARERRRLAGAGAVLGPVALEERMAEVLDCRCALLRRYG
ncbi:MAG: GNAT family N-acetyltransferase, partial [Egibacteraceae bacterium]